MINIKNCIRFLLQNLIAVIPGLAKKNWTSGVFSHLKFS